MCLTERERERLFCLSSYCVFTCGYNMHPVNTQAFISSRFHEHNDSDALRYPNVPACFRPMLPSVDNFNNVNCSYRLTIQRQVTTCTFKCAFQFMCKHEGKKTKCGTSRSHVRLRTHCTIVHPVKRQPS